MYPRILPVSVCDQPFLSYRPFWDKCTEWPLQGQVYPIYVTNIRDFQIFIRFALRRAVVELRAILRKVPQMTPKWPQTLKSQMYLLYVLPVSTSPKFYSISLYDEPFSSYRPFWEKSTEWPQHDLERCKLKSTPYALLVSLAPKFHPVSLYGQPFLRYRTFWDKCTKWPPKWPWTLQGQVTVYMYKYTPWSPNFTPFWCTTNRFRDTANLETSAINDPKMTLNPTRSKVPHICY